jgi:hypothetical protein
MERSIIRITDVDNAEGGYWNIRSIRNVVMEKNDESEMDRAQNEWRSAGNIAGKEDVNKNNKKGRTTFYRTCAGRESTPVSGMEGTDGVEQGGRKTERKAAWLDDWRNRGWIIWKF